MSNNGDPRNVPDRARRALIAGTGAGVAALVAGGPAGAVSFADSRAASRGWDREADVVIAGAGAAASSAALFAKDAGAEVLMLEKGAVMGGTAAKSGGVIWIPNNSTMRANGLSDPRDDALRYMLRLAYPHKYDPAAERYGASPLEYDLVALLYDEGAKTMDGLAAMGALETVPWYTWEMKYFVDYYHHLPENKAPRGRALVPKYPDPTRHVHPGNGGDGAEIMRQMRVALDARGIPILTRHRVARLVTSNAGEIVGVEATLRDGTTVAVRARRGVVFASGGFTHNPDYRQNFLRGPTFGGCAVPSNEGDFIRIAAAVGAAMGNLANAWWAQHTLELALDLPSTPTGIWVSPGDSMLQVNKYGRRFMNEKFHYNERTQLHFAWDPIKAEYPNLISFLIFDGPCLEKFPGAHPIPAAGGPLPDYVLEGATLAELAGAIDARAEALRGRTGGFALDESFAVNLADTCRRYNEMAIAGTDLDFHRGELAIESDYHLWGVAEVPDTRYPNVMMQPLAEHGPYYCVLLCPGTLDTKGGARVNTRMQVLHSEGAPIPGLYAAGNCTAHPAGQAYWGGGGTIGPALTMGRVAGLDAAAQSVRAAV